MINKLNLEKLCSYQRLLVKFPDKKLRPKYMHAHANHRLLYADLFTVNKIMQYFKPSFQHVPAKKNNKQNKTC